MKAFWLIILILSAACFAINIHVYLDKGAGIDLFFCFLNVVSFFFGATELAKD